MAKGVPLEVVVLTGGQDRHYASGLISSLKESGVSLEVIGSNEVECPEFDDPPRVKFLNLMGDRSREARFTEKVSRISRYYIALFRYVHGSTHQLFHILWNNRLETFDRTFLMAYYRLEGKKIALTAHNVNTAKRDSRDTFLNRWSLAIQYRLSHHIFVHTPAMKEELIKDFGVKRESVTVIPYGINNAVPDTNLRTAIAKEMLGLRDGLRTILFFGAIAPYKGLDLLVDAFKGLDHKNDSYRLIVAGAPKGGCEQYLAEVRQSLRHEISEGWVIERIEHIPDIEVELYFKAADLLVLPYRAIFQSGILFLGYSFGLPVVATDVGSFRDSVEEGTGLLCEPNDPEDMARAITQYFESTLYKDLPRSRLMIKEKARSFHSWDEVAALTRNVYCELLDMVHSPGERA